MFDRQIMLDLIKKKREIWKKGSGRNLHASLKDEFEKHSIKIGRDRFFDLLRENGLLIKSKKRKAITTLSYHHFHKYPNLIQGLIPLRAGEIIVSDITYIWIEDIENFAYLFLITDVYSRKIIGFCLSDNLKASSAIKALKMALKQIDVFDGRIHHSDRGIQYCCHNYTGLLKKNGILISMTEKGDPRENPIAERVNKTIKEEFTEKPQLSFQNLMEAKKEIARFIEFYNNKRPHRSIDMLTPAQAFNMKGELKRKWKSYLKYKKLENQLEGDFFQA